MDSVRIFSVDLAMRPESAAYVKGVVTRALGLLHQWGMIDYIYSESNGTVADWEALIRAKVSGDSPKQSPEEAREVPPLSGSILAELEDIFGKAQGKQE